jgi:hypothetical protein
MEEGPGQSPFVISAHAAVAIAERNIDDAWIKGVMRKPERVEADKTDPELRHALGRIAERDGRVLRVVYNHTVTPVRVVTAYFDRSMRKRL